MRRPDDDQTPARAERTADGAAGAPLPPQADRILITAVDDALELISAGNSWYRHHRNRTARAWSGTQGQLLADSVRLLLPLSGTVDATPTGEVLCAHPSAEAMPFVRAWRQPRLMRDRIKVTGTALRSRDETSAEPDAVDAVARIEVEGPAPVWCVPVRTRLFTISPMAVSLVFDHTVVLPRIDPERPVMVRYGSITIPQPLMPSMGASRMEFDVEILTPVRPADGDARPAGRALHAMLPAGPARSGKSPAYAGDETAA